MSDWNKVKKWAKKAARVLAPGMVEAAEGLYSAGEGIANQAEKAWDHISGERAADKANQAAMKAWEMQNEYNTPANQMKRLLEAGLNPNLAYNMATTGNANSAPDITHVADPVARVSSLLGHAFNAVQLMNSIQARKDQAESRQFQEQYQRDVLAFRKHQADVDNAFRMQQMAYYQSHTQHQYDNWMREFDERVRHNKAMEGKPTTMGMLDNVVYGMTGKHTNDVLSSAGRLEKKYVEKALFGKHSPFGGIARIHGKYF